MFLAVAPHPRRAHQARRHHVDGDAERRERPGTGLGLPLTRALAQANRARFSISSERRKGTLVEITFPTTRVLAD